MIYISLIINNIQINHKDGFDKNNSANVGVNVGINVGINVGVNVGVN